MNSDLLLLTVAAPFVGSFLGVMADRLPAGRPVVLARSCCDHCGARLGPVDLVPLASWLWLRGRCRRCRALIDPSLPAIELGALVIVLWASLHAATPSVWLSVPFGWTLLALAFADARHFVLPDALTLPLIPAGLAAAFFIEPDTVRDRLLGVVLGAAVFAALRWVYRSLRRREGLGFGDVKLIAAAGAWVGAAALPSVVLIAAVVGLAFALLSGARRRRLSASDKLPFGSFLCLGLWLVWLYGPLIFVR
jgi:leader peptidase (prepilin peptidase)/N-methyltransferase